MSALTARSALVLQLAQLDATECAGCSHPLKSHLPSLNGKQVTACKFWRIEPHPKGYKFGNGKTIECKCKRFVDPSEQLPIDAKGGTK